VTLGLNRNWDGTGFSILASSNKRELHAARRRRAGNNAGSDQGARPARRFRFYASHPEMEDPEATLFFGGRRGRMRFAGARTRDVAEDVRGTIGNRR